MASFILAGEKMSINQEIIKLCFFGPSGSGKSTVAVLAKKILLEKNYSVQKINVGQPLHQIQDYIYDLFDLPNTGQDGQLLQFIAHHFEGSLGPYFSQKIESIENQNVNGLRVIINSDCRNNSYQYLKKLNFKFIRVLTSQDNVAIRLQTRGDISLAQKCHSVEQTNQIIPDYFLDNNDTLVSLESKTEILINQIINQSQRVSLRELY